MEATNLLLDFIPTLKNDGFKIYTSDKKDLPTWCYFVKDNKIGYMQIAYFGGLTFSTVHVPCKNFGTGFGLHENGIYEPTLQNAYDTFIIAPQWARGNIKDVKKFTSWAEFEKRESVLTYKEI
jgi:hypothetical protein